MSDIDPPGTPDAARNAPDSFRISGRNLPQPHQNHLHSSALGTALRAARRGARLTQAELAHRAGCSVPAILQAERGLGGASLFMKLAACLGREVAGRPLPPGSHLGARLATLRGRRRLGRRAVALAAGISPTTVEAIERGGLGHLWPLERLAGAVGVTLILVPIGTAADFWSGAATSSHYHGWTTPPEILDHLYRVIGGRFDLDACSPCRGSRAPVRARLHYTAEDDGLTLPWTGRTFVNPPFGRHIGLWTTKAREEAACGRASVVVGLLPARVDSRWWHRDVADHAHVALLRGRLSYGDGRQAAPFPSAIALWGGSPEFAQRLRHEFIEAWHIGPAARLT